MFTAPLPPGRVEVLERLAGLPGLKSFYLAGGTAVALHLGHRISEDFDFFTPVEFDAATLRDELHVAGNFILTDIKRNTLHGIFDEVKVSFLFYAHRLVFQTHLFSGFPIADLHDLAPMKLDAVGSRGSKKDFIGLYFIANTAIPLMEIFCLYENKYSHLQINVKHLIMSLTYFEDAEKSRDNLVLLKKSATWSKIKEYFEKQAKVVLEEKKNMGVGDTLL